MNFDDIKREAAIRFGPIPPTPVADGIPSLRDIRAAAMDNPLMYRRHWEEVVPFAFKIKAAPAIDWREGWVNGDKRVREIAVPHAYVP